MDYVSIREIFAIYQRHLAKHKTRAEARGHAAGLLCLHGHFTNPTHARRYVRALYA
jgi:hypothetical protein